MRVLLAQAVGEAVLVRRLWLFAALAAVCVAAGTIAGVMYRELRTSEDGINATTVWQAFVNARSELAATVGLLLLAALIALGAAGVHVAVSGSS